MRGERPTAPDTSTTVRGARPDAPAVFLFTAHPRLDPLERGLQALGLNAMRVRSLAHARQLLAGRRDRCVAVLDTYQPAAYSFAAVYRLLHEAPAVPTLLVLHGESAPLPLVWEVAANTDDYARMPMPLAALQLRVQALLLHAGLPLPPPETSSAASEAPGRPAGQLVAVFGAKGGLGCSTIAANLAVELAQRHAQRVALIDAHLWFGNLATLLDVRGAKTLATLAATADHLDVDALTDVLVPHASGVQLLLPPKPTEVETVPPSLPARVAQAYRLLFDYVIVDTHPSLEEYVLQVLEAADHILLVTTPELAAIGCTAQVLELAPALGLRSKLLLVLNRANSGVRLEHLERTLGMQVDATIVSAGQRVVSAANRGVPLMALDPNGSAQVTHDLAALAQLLQGRTAPSEQRAAPRPAWRLPGWTPRLLPRPALVS